MSIGFAFPFSKASGSLGYLESTNDEVSAARANLLSLLTTNWGERVMNYSFGCNFKEFLFEQVNEETKQKVADRILSQVSRWLPYVEVDELQVATSEDSNSVPDNFIAISIQFSISEFQSGSLEILLPV